MLISPPRPPSTDHHPSPFTADSAIAARSTRRWGVLICVFALTISSNFTLLETSKLASKHKPFFSTRMRQCCTLLQLLLLALLWAAPLLCLASSPTTPAEVLTASSAALPQPRNRDTIFAAKMASTGARTTPSATIQHGDAPPRPKLSKRALDTEPAHIEAVLSKYAGMSPPPANLAQGVAHWDPPPAALQQMVAGLEESTNHKYGPALGLPVLRQALAEKLEAENGLDMTGQEVLYHTTPRPGVGTPSRCLC